MLLKAVQLSYPYLFQILMIVKRPLTDNVTGKLHTTVSIWQVGDCVLQTYQTEMKLERATTVEFTTISPICYIHC